MNPQNPNQSPAQTQIPDPDDRQLIPGLYVIATPIGNARDITLRALDMLRGADVLLVEDSRVSAKLLSLHGIRKPLISLHDHNESRSIQSLMERVRKGERLALLSDAGTPLVSDPGYKLVRAFIAEGLFVTHLPGPSAVLTGLVLSGLAPDRFLFCGFLPAKAGERRRAIAGDQDANATLIYFESGQRLAKSLADLAELLGPRPAVVARELTKLYEQVRRAPLDALAVHYAEAPPPKGEIVLVISGPLLPEPVSEARLDEALRAALAHASVKEAAQSVAAELGLPKRQVYQRALALAQADGDET
ncbi:MAG TPA: 16S rRNA (cytidine(1402)-2'-O)-methyltransferase [Alphaproteobacteria bacterium]|nr:16S rRNA (cytidine(1402)-2'-O)-methyltransferase [Alphaproteobacteria bacterium]